jgi:hypothetical protein
MLILRNVNSFISRAWDFLLEYYAPEPIYFDVSDVSLDVKKVISIDRSELHDPEDIIDLAI